MKLRTRHMNRALSTVLTTIIILVASVVLATGVVLYGTSLFQTSTQQEAISVSGLKVFTKAVDPNGLTWGAFAVRNTGDKILSVNKITVRGEDVPFTQWFPDTSVTSALLQQAMKHSGWSGVGGNLSVDDPDADCGGTGTIQIDLDGAGGETAVCAIAATGPIGLEPGDGAIIYFKLTNGTIESIDAGISTAVGIFAGNSGAPISVTVSSKT